MKLNRLELRSLIEGIINENPTEEKSKLLKKAEKQFPKIKKDEQAKVLNFLKGIDFDPTVGPTKAELEKAKKAYKSFKDEQDINRFFKALNFDPVTRPTKEELLKAQAAYKKFKDTQKADQFMSGLDFSGEGETGPDFKVFKIPKQEGYYYGELEDGKYNYVIGKDFLEKGYDATFKPLPKRAYNKLKELISTYGTEYLNDDEVMAKAEKRDLNESLSRGSLYRIRYHGRY